MTRNYLKISTKIAIFTIGLLTFIPSCKKEEITNLKSTSNYISNSNKSGENGATYTNNEGELILGQKINNPYTVANMTTAYNNIKTQNDPLNLISTSHYYVRFLPASEKQLDELIEDGLELFSYPLDYEILEGGVTYHDPNIDTNSITWQYTVVPENYNFNQNIQTEILSNLFIPEHIQDNYGSVFNGIEIENELLDNILIEAYLLSGHQDKLDEGPQGFFKLKPKWTPKGKITVHDDRMLTQLELEGVKVRVTKLLVIKTAFTDASGNYTINQVRGNVNYSIKWETGQYDIRDRFGSQAMHNGPKQQGDWNLNIVSDKTLGFATVHRAAYRYHYKFRGGLISPKPAFRLNIKYVHQNSTGALGINFGNNWNLSFFNNIKIWGFYSNGTQVETYKMFNTTIHELAHSAHIKQVNSIIGIGGVDPIIRESWAEAVAQFITKIEYDNLGFPNFDEALENQFTFNLQQIWSNTTGEVVYTPLFIDVFDNYNQHYRNSTNCVMGYGPFRSDVCLVGTPPAGTTAKISTDGTYFYYTANGNQSIPQIFIPSGAEPLIRDNKYYVRKTGLPRYPNDELEGYSIADVESNLNDIKSLSELETYLKANKPINVTDDEIDVFLDIYYNL